MIDVGMEEISRSMNLLPVSHDELRRFIVKRVEKAISSHLKVIPPAVFVHGLAGVGKTYSVYAAAEELAEHLHEIGYLPTPEVSGDPSDLGKKLVVWEVLAETMTPVDVSPTYVDQEKGVSRKYPPEWLVRLSTRNVEAVKAVEAFRQGEQVSLPVAILLLDELPNAPPDTLKAIQKLLYERRIEDVRLLPTVFIVATGNILEDNADLSEFSNPQKSRMFHLLLRPPTADEWVSYMLSRDTPVNPRVVAFVKAYPNMLYVPPSSGHEAFPCPRTWDMAAVQSYGEDNKETALIVGACCGRAAEEAFATFAASLGDDPAKYIRNPKLFIELEPSAKAIVAMSAASRLIDAVKRGETDEEVIAFTVSLAKGVPPGEAKETLAKQLFARAAAYAKYRKSIQGDKSELTPDELAAAINDVYGFIASSGGLMEEIKEMCLEKVEEWLPSVQGIEVKASSTLNIDEFENALVKSSTRKSAEYAMMILTTVSDAAEKAGVKEEVMGSTGLKMVMGADLVKYVNLDQ